ncbi:TetR/AcrR family transcriptional regulator [Pseudomonas sp. RIT412]|nr:TetR/AcrR family transcriptional regulator [Pseudomonas sp. RIT 409]RAU54224.1 TetR/AcrR family transcriptional regulator [Pseudomonas sp. RIT 412]
MGRPRKFNRESVLEKALPVFWKHGFAGTSLQHLEQATGVNKSGLYSEFQDKEDLFFNALAYYYQHRGALEILSAQPLGWTNIERFLRLGERQENGCTGCFSVNALREISTLSDGIRQLLNDSHRRLMPEVVANVHAENTKLPAEVVSDLVMVFFSGVCVESSLRVKDSDDPVGHFMQALKLL